METSLEESGMEKIGARPERRQAKTRICTGTRSSACIHTVLNQELDEFLAGYQKQYPAFSGLASGQKTGPDLYWECLQPPAFSGNRTALQLLEKAKGVAAGHFTFLMCGNINWVQTEKLLEKWGSGAGKRTENWKLRVNDWAMADMLKRDFPELIPRFGRMVNKRKKIRVMACKKAVGERLRKTARTQNSTGISGSRNLEYSAWREKSQRESSWIQPAKMKSGKSSAFALYQTTNTLSVSSSS